MLHVAAVQTDTAAHVAVDRVGKIWHWDSEAERLFSWPAKLALGQSACNLLTPERLLDERIALFSQMRRWSGRLVFLRGDQSEIDVNVVRTPIQSPDGRVVGVLGAHRLARAPVAGLVRQDSDEQPTMTRESLTARELEVVRYVPRGLTNREIGAALGMGAGSVANHIDRIFMKLGLRRRSELASWAVRQGLR